MVHRQEPVGDWECTNCENRPLNLGATLTSGQAFRWRQDAAGIWWGAVGTSGLALWQRSGDSRSPLFWQTFPQAGQRELVETYLGLEVPLVPLYQEWVSAEPRMQNAIELYHGLRILRQPPVECFFAFQCATCNTVVKIERSVHRLALRYGAPIEIDFPESAESGMTSRDDPPPLTLPDDPAFSFFAFPEIETLAIASEDALRSDLWGYRAPRVIALAKHLLALGPDWLANLHGQPYARAKEALVALHGIGEKVADCICLFSLGKDEATPVDTHVRQIACSLFVPELRDKSLTPRVYAAISDAYQERFGAYAGWAQQYLFLGAMRGKKA